MDALPRRRSPPAVSSFPPRVPLHYPSSSGSAYSALPTSAPTQDTEHYRSYRDRPYASAYEEESGLGFPARDEYSRGTGVLGFVAGLRYQRSTRGRVLLGLAGAAMLYFVYEALSRSGRPGSQDGGHLSSPRPKDGTNLHRPEPEAPLQTSTISSSAVSKLDAAEAPSVNMDDYIQPRRPVPPAWPDPWVDVDDPSFRGRELLSVSRFGSEEKGWKVTPAAPEQDFPPAQHLLAALEYTAAIAGKSSDGTRAKLNPGMGFDERTGRPTKIEHAKLKLEGEGWRRRKGYKLSELGKGKLGEQKLPKVQAERAGEDDEERIEEEKSRRGWVKRAFQHAWSGYAEHAWGHDELSPTSSLWSNNYNGWGATLVDALDTLLIMNMSTEYNRAREHVAAIDFTFLVPSGGKTFSTNLPPIEALRIPGNREEPEEGSKKWVDPRLQRAFNQRSPTTLSWFETLIRYLGAFLTTYELSGDPLMLDRATELGDWLLPSFATKYGLPINRYAPGYNPDGANAGRGVLAEVGSCILEMTKLSQLTGNDIYFEAAQRTMDVLDKHFAIAEPRPTDTKKGALWRGRLGTLLPAHLDPAFPKMLQGEYGFGGLADSYYEYLIKQAQLTSFSTEQYPRMYATAINAAYEHLIKPIESVPGREDLTLIGNLDWGTWKHDLQHLTCFAGAMLGLGAKLLNRPHDLETGINVTNACVWVYESSASGIGGESTTFYKKDDPSRFAVLDDPDGEGKIRTPRGSPVGVRSANRRQIGRPETIESVFYMYRLTGDRKWQDQGWTMFCNWVQHSITEFGFATVRDVNSVPVRQEDSQESFVLAETLKYYYLLFSPLDFFSLDDFVFNTEAHPLWIPKPSALRQPTSYWTGPDENSPPSFASQIGEGTWVQKWARVQQAAALAGASTRGSFAGAGAGGGRAQPAAGGARPPGAPARPFVRPAEAELEAAKAAAKQRVQPIELGGAHPPTDQALQGGGRGMGGRPI
ncbi:hypothetical protein JCM11641_007510 [Rhodosporidiobolus odoratus]